MLEKGQRKAVRLDEVGPRMEMRLIKISEGVPGKEGAVTYHGFGIFSLVLCLVKPLMVLFSQRTKKKVEAQKAEHAAKAKLKAHTGSTTFDYPVVTVKGTKIPNRIKKLVIN
jgi:ribosome biogenesis protein SSF1/2